MASGHDWIDRMDRGHCRGRLRKATLSDDPTWSGGMEMIRFADAADAAAAAAADDDDDGDDDDDDDDEPMPSVHDADDALMR